MNTFNLNLTSVYPRQQHFSIKKMMSSEELIDDFRNNPKSFLKKYGVDTSELTINLDSLPSREVMLSRLEYYMEYEEFGSPAKLAVPFVVFLVFLIPTPAL